MFDANTTNQVLLVAAHPDDEVLGAGGTIARHAAAGDTVRVLILGDGETSRDMDADTSRRADQAREAGELLGASDVHIETFPDNQFDSVSLLQIVQAIERYCEGTEPAIVYTHHAGDLNIDHRITAEAVMTAFRAAPDSPVTMIVAFEVLSSTEWQRPDPATVFIPACYVNITDTLAAKQEALAVYHEEMRPYPHPRSSEAVEALAMVRGVTSGYQYAEAFELLRERYF